MFDLVTVKLSLNFKFQITLAKISVNVETWNFHQV